MFSCGIATLLFAALLSVSPTVRPQVPDRAEFCSTGSDVKRFSVLRETILSKLGMLLPANITSQWTSRDRLQEASRRVDPALVTAYETASRALEDEDSSEPLSCAKSGRGRGTQPFAKRISLFFPMESGITYMHSATPESGNYNTYNTVQVRGLYTCIIMGPCGMYNYIIISKCD